MANVCMRAFAHSPNSRKSQRIHFRAQQDAIVTMMMEFISRRTNNAKTKRTKKQWIAERSYAYLYRAVRIVVSPSVHIVRINLVKQKQLLRTMQDEFVEILQMFCQIRYYRVQYSTVWRLFHTIESRSSQAIELLSPPLPLPAPLPRCYIRVLSICKYECASGYPLPSTEFNIGIHVSGVCVAAVPKQNCQQHISLRRFILLYLFTFFCSLSLSAFGRFV